MLLAHPTTRRAERRAAFTLLEVLVVVAILVILAGVGVVATTRYLENARKSQAQLQCQALANACETYYLDAQSGHTYPESLQVLLNPFGNGGSLLKNGQADLIDPWGNPYQYQVQTDPNSGNVRPYVTTTAPDQTLISQRGIGLKAN